MLVCFNVRGNLVASFFFGGFVIGDLWSFSCYMSSFSSFADVFVVPCLYSMFWVWRCFQLRFSLNLCLVYEDFGWCFNISWWWWIVFVVWLTDERRLALFSDGTIVRDPHHLESPTHRKQDLNLCRTWVQALLNEVVQ